MTLGLLALITALILAACSDDKETTPNDGANTGEESHENMDMHKEGSDSMEGMDGHMSHDEVVSLNDSTGENELKIPPVLEDESAKDEEIAYTVRAQKGETEIFDGIQTKTLGYNGAFLGPVLHLEKGDTVKIKLINELEEDTTFHCHGLEVPGDADRGPTNTIKQGEEDIIYYKVSKDTLRLLCV